MMMVLMALFSLYADAYDNVEIKGISYVLIDDGSETAIVTSGSKKYSGKIVIPESFKYRNVTYSVTEIGWSAFGDCSGLTSVTIPNSVTIIQNRAFAGCSGLTSVTIPKSVLSIHDMAFVGCSNLRSIIVEDGNAVYDSRDDCNAIIETATNTLFRGCINTKIPNSVTSIGIEAFGGCRNLTSITIPNSVTEIGQGAFSGCCDLTSVTIPNSVTAIGYNAFNGTAWYDNQPEGLVYAGNVAYKYKGTMPENTSITIKDGTIGISSGAFAYCSGLSSVTIPNSVLYIGGGAFVGCESLVSVEIPNSVTKLDVGMGELYVGVFAYCSGLTSVVIPGNVEMSSRTFDVCTSLTSITVEIKDITSWCTKPLSIKSLEWYHAYNRPSSFSCHFLLNNEIMDDLFIPQNVTSVSNEAFAFCHDFTSVKVAWSRPLAGGADSFEAEVKKNAPLYVPKGTAMMYMAAPGWSEFVNIVEYGDDVDAIESVIADDSEYQIYTIDGTLVEALQKGVNIIKYKNGTLKKVVVK